MIRLHNTKIVECPKCKSLDVITTAGYKEKDKEAKLICTACKHNFTVSLEKK